MSVAAGAPRVVEICPPAQGRVFTRGSGKRKKSGPRASAEPWRQWMVPGDPGGVLGNLQLAMHLWDSTLPASQE